MPTFSRDIAIIRELAKQQMEFAMSDKHVCMRKRFQDTNDLKIVRPPLIIEELPWHEMNFDGMLNCRCEDEHLRGIEFWLRTSLLREKYFRCDNFITPYWVVPKSFSNTGNGFQISADQLVTDAKNNIVSRHYHDVLEDESSLEAYHDPVITPHPENDAENVAHMQEIFGDSMPVVLRGHSIYHSPWDTISELRGVEPILIDIYDRPEYLHKIISLFTRSKALEMDQMEKYGLYDPEAAQLHCTPGMFTHKEPYDISFGTCRDIWFRTMAQMFSTVSPDAHFEFDVQYSIPLAKRCAYTYYGCCEPLHDRIDMLKHYPNLRKIGVSPWAKMEESAEQIGGSYVLSRKPNPANVAITADPDVIRKEITQTVTACQKYGCPCDITLKDISTVSYKPENIITWAKTASEVLDAFYGEA